MGRWSGRRMEEGIPEVDGLPLGLGRAGVPRRVGGGVWTGGLLPPTPAVGVPEVHDDRITPAKAMDATIEERTLIE